jgi:hypothetical protein
MKNPSEESFNANLEAEKLNVLNFERKNMIQVESTITGLPSGSEVSSEQLIVSLKRSLVS